MRIDEFSEETYESKSKDYNQLVYRYYKYRYYKVYEYHV